MVNGFLGAAGCSGGSTPLFEPLDELEFPDESLVTRSVELSINRLFLDSLLQGVPDMIPEILGENEDGTSTLELDTNFPTNLPSIPLGAFGSNVGFRELVVTIDPKSLEISSSPNAGNLIFSISTLSLPVRLDHAVVFGDAEFGGIPTSAACIIETKAPDFTTYITMDATVELFMGSSGNIEPEIQISTLELTPLVLTVSKDCTQPECSDQLGSETPCFECEMCTLAGMGGDFLPQLQNILEDSLKDVLPAIIEEIFNRSIAGNLPILGEESALRIHPELIGWDLIPVSGPILGKLGAIDLGLEISQNGFRTSSDTLDLSLDISTRSPTDKCAMNRPPLEASSIPEELPWPEYAPTENSSGVDYDFAARLNLDWIERLIDEGFRSGMACMSLYDADLAAFLDLADFPDQGIMHLLFPDRRFLGDPEHGLRMRLNAPPSETPVVQIETDGTHEGSLKLRVLVSGLEIILAPTSSEGPTWLTLKPELSATLSVQLSKDQGLLISIVELDLKGLDKGLPPATSGESTAALLSSIETLLSSIRDLPPFEIDPSTFGEELLANMKIVGLQQYANRGIEIYFGTDGSLPPPRLPTGCSSGTRMC